MQSNNQEAFFDLVRAGLWGKKVQLLQCQKTDFFDINRLAEEQSIVGLVTAGLDYLTDTKISKKDVLQFVGRTMQLEQRNAAMNTFIGTIVDKLKEDGIKTLLIKGQGVAECYVRPLWRTSGDVDLMLDSTNYQRAKEFLLPLASSNKQEERYSKHLGMTIDPWYVEIHGTLRTGLSARVDKEIDAVYEDTFNNNHVRTWMNGETEVFLPSADNDVFLVFTHFIKHFYKEGMSLKQVCDWIRLLWTYRDEVDTFLLEKRLRRSGLVSEWQAFAAMAVEYLGMPTEAMPLYNAKEKWNSKSRKIVNLLLDGYSGSRVKDTIKVAMAFPWKTLCYLPGILLNVNCLKIKERILGQ